MDVQRDGALVVDGDVGSERHCRACCNGNGRRRCSGATTDIATKVGRREIGYRRVVVRVWSDVLVHAALNIVRCELLEYV